MATFLDISLLNSAKVVFTFLLVFVVVWGLLTWIKPFGKSMPNGPYAIIALVAGFFTVISSSVRYLVEFMVPWFLFLILFIFFIIFVFRMWGLGEDAMVATIKHGGVMSMVLIVIGIIMLFALGSTFGQKSLEATQGQVQGVYYQGEGAYNNANDNGGTVPVTTPGGVVQPLEPGADLNYAASPGGYGTGVQPGQAGATNTGSFSLNLINTRLHPTVMAIIAVFLIGTIAVWLLARPEFI